MENQFECNKTEIGAEYSMWTKVCHNAMTMPESREAHRK